jgi:hypothetical protein
MASVVTDLTLAQIQEQVAKYWVPVYNQELRCKEILPALIPRVQMPDAVKGDTIYVSEVKDLAGDLRALSDCSFESEALQVERVAIPCDQRAYAALKFCDVVELQTALSLENAQVRMAMMNGMLGQINSHLYGQIVCNTINATVPSFDADQITTLTKQADDLCWPENDRWLLVDSQYKKDMLDSAILTNSDFGAADSPVIGGTFVLQRYGWNIVFDNTAPFKASLNAGQPGVALAYTSGFLLMCEGYANRVKMSDSHSSCEWALNATVDTIFGAAPGTAGADKCIVTKTQA